MSFNIKSKKECRYDAVSMGEVMIRLDPGNCRIRNTREFRVWEGGGEYNVIKGLSKCFGLHSGMITAFADNEIGYLLEDLMMQAGVDTSLVYWMPTDGIGSLCRNGLNFTEGGFGIRGMLGVSDRANTAIAKATAADFELEDIFGNQGVRWFHTGGIYAALSENSLETLEKAMEIAHKYGTVISYDLNYRGSLWQAQGRPEKTIEINRRIVSHVDVLIGNEAEFAQCLGILTPKNPDPENDSLNQAGFEQVLSACMEQFPNLKAAAAILHKTQKASSTELAAVGIADGQIYRSMFLPDVAILDSVGPGDAFGTGLVYGLMECGDMKMGLDYGIANSAHVFTTPGDTTMARKNELDAIIKSGGASQSR